MYKSRIADSKKRANGKMKNREFIVPDDEQTFAVVKDMLGNGRLNALCHDGVVRMGRIRGSLRKGSNRAIINRGDLIIVAMREFEDKVDVVHRYTHDEASMMFRNYQIPEALKKVWKNDISVGCDEAGEGEVDREYVDFANSDDELNINAI